MRTRTAALCAALTAACSGSDPAGGIGSLALGEPLDPPRHLREAAPADAGGADLLFPARPTLVGDRLWVVDVGNDRLVRFDSALATASVFGREGEGPGEIRFAHELISDRSRLLVGDAGNGRVSIFDTAGDFRASVPWRRGAGGALDLLAGGLVTAGVDERHYTFRIAEDGTVRPHARIPDALRRLARSDPSLYPPATPYIAATPEGRLYVVDTSVLAVAVFEPDGALVEARLLPEPYRTGLLEYRGRTDAAFGGGRSPFMNAPGTKRVSLDSGGGLLVLFAQPEHWGLLIDPRSWTARPLPLPAEDSARQILWSASDARRYGDRLFVSGEQLHEFRIEGWP